MSQQQEVLDFKTWKDQNLHTLALQFADAFGRQTHEFTDFAEGKYARYVALSHSVCRLLCSCCGAETRGRQWHNRDTGYGLCPSCIDQCSRKVTPEDFRRCYGDRGIHFDIDPQTRHYTVSWVVDIEITGDHKAAAQAVADQYFQSRIGDGEQGCACSFIVTEENGAPVEIDLAASLSELEGDNTQ
ncbi:hypothetical protein [Pseudomonas syringae pv. coryli]|uniref:hypothetical protein n=1 Tax=Pseudomonas syringae pv. coryli TaxID=317659 RepID=UPI003D2E2209